MFNGYNAYKLRTEKTRERAEAVKEVKTQQGEMTTELRINTKQK